MGKKQEDPQAEPPRADRGADSGGRERSGSSAAFIADQSSGAPGNARAGVPVRPGPGQIPGRQSGSRPAASPTVKPFVPPRVARDPENPSGSSQGFIKTTRESTPAPAAESRIAEVPDRGAVGIPDMGRPAQGSGTKYRKVAKLLVLLGQEEGARILSKLDAEQVDGIAREIAKVSTVDPVEAERILSEFKSLFASFSGRALQNAGGIPAARHLLHRAFGKEKGEALLKRAVPESQENPFSFLEDLEGDHAALLLKDESPTMAAMVLSRVSPKTAAAALGCIEAPKRLPILKGMANLGKISPEVLERVAAAMREKARSIGSVESRGVDGKSALAAILRNTDPAFGEQLLGELEDEDPELGRDLKERVYTLDDIVRSDDRPIQERLRSMSDRDIALLLKGRSPDFIDKIRSNLSAGRRTIIEQERELLGPVPRKDAEAIARDFLAWFRRGRMDGKIAMDGDASFV